MPAPGQAAASAYIAAILPLLRDESADVRRTAFQDLGALGSEAVALVIEAIVSLLQDENDGVRLRALQTIGRTEEAAAHIGAVIPLLQDENARVRCAALEALGNTGEAAALHIGAIVPLLQDENDGVRLRALKTIGRTEEAAAHIGAVVPLLQDENAVVRRTALQALGNTGDAASLGREAVALVVEAIVPLLRDESAWVSHEALRALGNIGHAASPYIADINALLDQNSDAYETAAARATLLDQNSCAALVLETLAKISVAAARAAAVSALSQDPRVHLVAVRLLALHSLLEALTSEHEQALLQLQFNLPQGADKTNVMRVVSQSRKLRGHASQTALCQHVRNLSGASLSMAFESMKQLNRQGKQYWCKHELTSRHVETVLERCISENAVDQLVRTLNTSRVLPVAISPLLHRLTVVLDINLNNQPHLQAIELRCSRWRAKKHVLALLWKQCLPWQCLPWQDVVVSISNTIL